MQIQIVREGDTRRNTVRDEEGLVLAEFDWFAGDWSFGLQAPVKYPDKWAIQRNVRTEDEVRKRIDRIFDETSLRDEIEKLYELNQNLKKLRDEKFTTTSSKRYKELTDGDILRDAEIAGESQHDIVNAKFLLQLGMTVSTLNNIAG